MKDWISNKTTQESLGILRDLSSVCADLGGPLSKTIYAMVEAGDYLGLVNFELDYKACMEMNFTIPDVRMARQILAFYSKNEWLDVGIDRDLAAMKRFKEAEVQCLETNRRIKDFAFRPNSQGSDVHRVLHVMTRKIADILGVAPNLDTLSCAFGPGGNTNVLSALACPRAKLSAPLECSADLSPTVGEILSEFPMWVAHHAFLEDEESWFNNVTVVPGKLMFVPKNAKTNRSIVIEPLINSIVQKGYGSYIRDRLCDAGLNLRDTQSWNQTLAFRGSNSGLLATIDLSMASDCLATEVVHLLLPYEWAEKLSACRTSEVSYQGTLTKLNKFSSMGNGFTFELETLIFWCLATSVCNVLRLPLDEVSTFGDDIIVPVDAVPLLTQMLSFIGFTVNSSKSFSEGPFRESCGADFYLGFDIRPFYSKTRISERVLYTMHNWFIRNGEIELAASVRQRCNPDLALYGPDGYGDGHLIGSYQLRTNRESRKKGWCGGYFESYCLNPKSFKKPLPGDAVLPTYSVYVRSGADSPTDPNVVRGSVGYSKISIYTLRQGIFLS